MSELVQIDGSMMEGGGQIIRTASAMSVLTQKPVRIFNIRANRPQAGLRTQHLRGLEATSAVCGGRVEGARLGSKDVIFYPGKIPGKQIKMVIETAGSVGLAIQSVMIASMKAREKLMIEIDGGATFGKYAPPLEYIQFVLLPLLRRMGYHAEINILNHGFYPAGGAKVNMIIEPCCKLKPIDMAEPGKLEEIRVISTASNALRKPRVAERQVRSAEEILKKYDVRLDKKTKYSDSLCPGSGLVLVARTENGCVLGSDGLGERGKKAEVVAEEAGEKMKLLLHSRSSVDDFMSDQILPYLAYCRKNSSFTAPELTMHAETNMEIIKQFLDVEFEIENLGRNIKIDCIH